MSAELFTRDLIHFIESSNGLPTATIEADTALIEGGYIDSFSIMELLIFIEERCGVSITIDSLSLDTVRTPKTIVETYAVRNEAEI